LISALKLLPAIRSFASVPLDVTHCSEQLASCSAMSSTVHVIVGRVCASVVSDFSVL